MSKSRKRKKFIKNRKIQKKIRKMRKTQKKIRKLQRGGAATSINSTLALTEGIGVAGKYHIDTLINNRKRLIAERDDQKKLLMQRDTLIAQRNRLIAERDSQKEVIYKMDTEIDLMQIEIIIKPFKARKSAVEWFSFKWKPPVVILCIIKITYHEDAAKHVEPVSHYYLVKFKERKDSVKHKGNSKTQLSIDIDKAYKIKNAYYITPHNGTIKNHYLNTKNNHDPTNGDRFIFYTDAEPSVPIIVSNTTSLTESNSIKSDINTMFGINNDKNNIN